MVLLISQSRLGPQDLELDMISQAEELTFHLGVVPRHGRLTLALLSRVAVIGLLKASVVLLGMVVAVEWVDNGGLVEVEVEVTAILNKAKNNTPSIKLINQDHSQKVTSVQLPNKQQCSMSIIS